MIGLFISFFALMIRLGILAMKLTVWLCWYTVLGLYYGGKLLYELIEAIVEGVREARRGA